MAYEKLGQALSALVLAMAILNTIETTSSQESCPYPCTRNPPPVSTTNNPTSSSAATTAPTQTGSYPAQPGAIYPPPVGYVPYNPPPPYGSSGGLYTGPPPPDPILPNFPYYYRKPPRKKTEESSATGPCRSTAVIVGVVASLGQLWDYLM